MSQKREIPFAPLTTLVLATAGLIAVGRLVLFDQDEAAYAGFGLVMERTGNYLVPDFLWSEPHRKTPLHFWLIASSIRLFGTSELAIRLPAILSMLGTWLAVWLMAPAIVGKSVSRLAVGLMAVSLISFLYGGISFTDGPLMLAETVAALALLNLWKKVEVKYALALVVSVGAGGLIKGPPIFILTLGMVGLFWLAGVSKLDQALRINHQLPSFWWQILWGVLILIGMGPLLVWGRMAWLSDNGVFISWLWDWYVTKRAGGAVWGQTGPMGYHLVVMGIAFMVAMPYMVNLIQDGQKAIRSKQVLQSEKAFLFMIWLIPGWLFYELQLSKLPSYALGAYPAFALLLADRVHTYALPKKSGIWVQTIFLALLCIALIGATFYALVLKTSGTIPASPFEIVLGLLKGLLVVPLANVLFRNINYLRGLTSGIVPVPAAIQGFAIFIFLLPAYVHEFDPLRGTTKTIAHKLGQSYQAGKGPVLIGNHFGQPSLPYYLMAEGIPYQFTEDEAQLGLKLDSLVNKHGQAFLICDAERLDHLKAKQPQQFQHAKIDSINGLVTDRVGGIQYRLVKLGQSLK